MKKIINLLLLAAIISSCDQPTSDSSNDQSENSQTESPDQSLMQAAPDAESLIKGEELEGWIQRNGEAIYSVENGEIVGTTVYGTPNSFLCTEKEYGDFILDLDLKVLEFNSGVQFRSLSTPDYKDGRVHGYQCEVDPSERKWSGGVYDEARRGWLYPLSVNPPAREAFKPGEWNHYKIEAIGNTIRTWVNGVPAAHLIDSMTASGFIALQVHSIRDSAQAGKEVRWKNIMIQTENLTPAPYDDIFVVNKVPNTLSAQEEAQGWKLLFDGSSTDMWRGAHAEEFPAVGWKAEDGLLKVLESGGGESEHGGDIVTKEEYSQFEFQVEAYLTEGANSGIKYFVTENYGPRKGSAIGLEYQLLDDEKHPDAKKGNKGDRTLASLYDLIPADKGNVNPVNNWTHARVKVFGTRMNHVIKPRPHYEEFSGANVEHWLNNILALDYDRGTQMYKALIQKSKYADFEDFGMWQKGHILLQDHGNEVHFRSIKVREL